MQKKLIVILTAVILIAAVGATVFIMSGKNTGDDEIPPITSDDIAKHSDKTKEEIDYILDTELTEEQKQALEQAEENSFVPDVAEVVDDDPTDDEYTVIDVNGDVYEVTDPFVNMSDADLAEYNENLKQFLDGETDTVNIPGTTGQPNQDLIDAGFEAIPSENGEDGFIYINPNIVTDDTDTSSELPPWVEDASGKIEYIPGDPYDVGDVTIDYGG